MKRSQNVDFSTPRTRQAPQKPNAPAVGGLLHQLRQRLRTALLHRTGLHHGRPLRSLLPLQRITLACGVRYSPQTSRVHAQADRRSLADHMHGAAEQGLRGTAHGAASAPRKHRHSETARLRGDNPEQGAPTQPNRAGGSVPRAQPVNQEASMLY
ncbi:hypothetical protein SAMN05444141_106355 [Pseudovibrio denitrificans]|uniref:Uncharacterized protein n=1 Tax=Pseudovibrio denitrificans TaxID=258256 RepID=A0A1I7CRW7_9HYPH|nr:hypothetical protein SAMN05444141_106355 [Pseudovibrio denitrificans]